MVVVADGSIDTIGIILNVFFNYREFLGYEKHEIIGQKVQKVIPR